MGKRKEPAHLEACKDIVGMPGVTDLSACAIYNKALPEDESVSRPAWTRMVHKCLPKECYEAIHLPHVSEETSVVFHAAKIPNLLQRFVDSCPNYARELKKHIAVATPAKPLNLIGYHDECTQGNIVAPDTAKKASLFYVAVREVGSLGIDCVWLPVGFIQHIECTKVMGGFGAVFRAMVEFFEKQKLPLGFPLRFDDATLLCCCRISNWIGDLDALRLSFDSKGSAGMKPCLRCCNVLKRNSGVVSLDDGFVEVGCDDPSLFSIQTDHEIFETVDMLLDAQRNESKAILKKKEVVAGFVANPHGLLADATLRAKCAPSMWLFDVMHLYYSNGIAAWEVNNMIHRLEENGVSLCVLQESISISDWKRSKLGKYSQCWRKQLLHESRFNGDCYRGDAEDLMCLLPLLWFYLSQCLNDDDLQPEMASFRKLLEIHFELRRLKHMTGKLDAKRLQQLQAQHQTLYQAAYGKDAMKPKHHVRFHVPPQIEEWQIYLDCLPMEKQHKRYKSMIAAQRFDAFARGSRNDEGQYSFIVLLRFCANQICSLKEITFEDSLLKPVKNRHDLQGRPYTTSTKAVLKGKAICVGDVLLGGQCSCMVAELCMYADEKQIFVWGRILQPLTIDDFHGRWKITKNMVRLAAKDLGSCAEYWSFEENDVVLCL